MKDFSQNINLVIKLNMAAAGVAEIQLYSLISILYYSYSYQDRWLLVQGESLSSIAWRHETNHFLVCSRLGMHTILDAICLQ